MLEIAEVEELRGRLVVGSDGNKIGKIDEIYLDEQSGRPEWALVNTGLFGLKSSFVLITGAEADGDQLTVPFDKATVKDAPSIAPEGALTPEEEELLFAHYGRDDYAGAAPAGASAPQGSPPRDTGADDGADTTEVAGPSASLAAARIAREDESGLGGAVADSDGTGGERTLEDLQELRRGPEGETGRSDTEDPVPPDGGPPPRQDHDGAPPAAAIGQEDSALPPTTAGQGASGSAASDPHTHVWEDEALAERGNATATPDSGPVSAPSENDALEAPETPDMAPPRGGSTETGRSRLRRYVAPGSAAAEGPGAPDDKQGLQ